MHFILARNQDVVPLAHFSISNLLLDVTLLAVNFGHEAQFVQVKVDLLAIA